MNRFIAMLVLVCASAYGDLNMYSSPTSVDTSLFATAASVTNQTVDAGKLQGYTAEQLSASMLTYYIWGSQLGPYTNFITRLAKLDSPVNLPPQTNLFLNVTNGQYLTGLSLATNEMPKVLTKGIVYLKNVTSRTGNTTPRYLGGALRVYEADQTTLVAQFLGSDLVLCGQDKAMNTIGISITNDVALSDNGRIVVINSILASGWGGETVSLYSQDGNLARLEIPGAGGGVWATSLALSGHTNDMTNPHRSTLALVLTAGNSATNSLTTGPIVAIGNNQMRSAGTPLAWGEPNGTMWGELNYNGTDTAQFGALSGLKLGFGANNSFSHMTVAANGNVGVGTVAPIAAHHVAKASNVVQQIIQANATQTANLTEWRGSDGSTVLSSINANGTFSVGTTNSDNLIQAEGSVGSGGSVAAVVRNVNSGGNGAVYVQNDTNNVGGFVCFGSGVAQATLKQKAAVISNAGLTLMSDSSTSSTGTNDIQFMTAGHNTQPKMFIKSDGKVGIGTNAPSTTLEVNGTLKAGATTLGVATVAGLEATSAGNWSMNSFGGLLLNVAASYLSIPAAVPGTAGAIRMNNTIVATNTQYLISLTPRYAQTNSTAANTEIYINRTETSVGTGTNSFVDFRVNGSTRFRVSNTGDVFAVGTTTTSNLVLSAVNYIDLIAPGLSLTGGGTAPALTATGTGGPIFGMGYQDDDYAFGSLQMPHSLALTNETRTELVVYPHVHWSYATAPAVGASNIQWRLNYEWANIGGGFSATGFSTVVASSLMATNSMITSFAPITNNAAGISSIFRFKLSRIPYSTDAYGSGTRVIMDQFDIHVPVDRIGSRQEYAQ